MGLTMNITDLFSRMLTVSTFHITRATSKTMDSEIIPLAIYPKGDYGWFIYVPDEQPFEGVPEDLGIILEYCLSKGYSWLNIDMDVPLNPNLPNYESDW
jgi:hypothetical protein